MNFQTVPEPYQEILNKDFLTAFRKGYVLVQGTTLPEYYRKFADQIENMDVRDDDVWVCSFPKTGTTWTQEMVWCIAHDVDLEAAKEFLPQRFPFLEHSPLFDFTDLLPSRPELRADLPDFVLDSVSYIERMSSPRFIKAHLPFHLLPKKLREGSTKAKIVYTARNPKDTCVSYYHHCCLMEGYKGPFQEFVQLFKAGYLCFAPYPDHLLGYWKHRSDPNLLYLKYEDMKKDLPSVIRQVAEFLNKSLTNQQVDILTTHLSFESMKKNPAVNYEPVIDINRKHGLITSPGSFMRSGKVGAWKETMNSSVEEDFEMWAEEQFAGSGLHWPFY